MLRAAVLQPEAVVRVVAEDRAADEEVPVADRADSPEDVEARAEPVRPVLAGAVRVAVALPPVVAVQPQEEADDERIGFQI